MPTYEYRCPEGHEFERFAKMSEAAASLPCPKCGKIAERQLSGGAGLVFKGSGFYLTDYGKNAHRTSGTEKPSSGGDTASGGGGESSPTASDSKASDSKASDSKAGDSKSSDAKPASGASDKSSGTKKPDT